MGIFHDTWLTDEDHQVTSAQLEDRRQLVILKLWECFSLTDNKTARELVRAALLHLVEP